MVERAALCGSGSRPVRRTHALIARCVPSVPSVLNHLRELAQSVRAADFQSAGRQFDSGISDHALQGINGKASARGSNPLRGESIAASCPLSAKLSGGPK